MKTAPGFWDSSALVPLCIHEAASASARSNFKRFSAVVWWGTLVEVHGAICRLNRAAEISDREKEGALRRAHLVSQGWKEILPSDRLRILAIELLDRYPLRASDSLQLAASLTWCGERPSRRTFICGDQRLAAAARGAGFTVVEIR